MHREDIGTAAGHRLLPERLRVPGVIVCCPVGVISSCGTQTPAEEADEATDDNNRGDGDPRDRTGREIDTPGGYAGLSFQAEAGAALLALTRPTAVCTPAYVTVKAPGPLLVGLLPFSARGALEGAGSVRAAGTPLNASYGWIETTCR